MKKNTAALILSFLITATGSLTAQMAASTSATPALLLAFTGKAQSSDALLSWTMEGQTNCKWFVIERSGDTGGYDSIGVVIGINNGNANNYTFSDDHMLKGNNYYRIRQVDMDGVLRYSKIVNLSNIESNNKMAIYPNPAIAVLNYNVSSPAAQQVIVQVYNLSGIILMSTQQQLNAGSNQQSLAISGLKSGNYILKVSGRTGSSQYVQPFVKIM